MDFRYTYLLIDIATIFFPFVLSFDRKVAFYRQWKYLWPGMLLTGLFFIAWDVLFTRMDIWSFNDTYILGRRLLGLPVEEWLFFLAIPYSCVFVYACLLAFHPFRSRPDRGWRPLLCIGIVLLLVAILHYRRAYTVSAFGLCGLGSVVLYLLRRKLRSFRADAFLISYLICLVPFCIVNGLLTALPVVRYTDAENLGIRLYTIPVEDVFYGMLLVMGNVAGMEYAAGNVEC